MQDSHQTRVQGKRARRWKVDSDDSDCLRCFSTSETAQTNCTGTGPSVLSQTSDKKVKTFDFLSTEGTTTTAVPAREKNVQVWEKHPSIRDNTFEPAALQPITAVSDTQKHLRQAPKSETGSKPMNCSSPVGITRADAEKRIREHGHTYDLNALTDAEVFSDADSLDAAFARQVGRGAS